ncbi:MAG: pyruvate dehydrogenase (acetyl-transferring), homodimeric type, partial [Gemmatimonadetes bacterium]|nr:pyruvate dehydrogenase (acetyl-transferring), homodimeric type [Gemmatimonadota bacterium]
MDAVAAENPAQGDVYSTFKKQLFDIDPEETNEWIESLDRVLDSDGPTRASFLLRKVLKRAKMRSLQMEFIQTPYINTISSEQEPEFPGDEVMEKRIRRIVRWNAAVMVTRANNQFPGLGGHISTYASAASLYEVGYNHFFRGPGYEGGPGDFVYFQGHAAPGIYSRAYLEGHLNEDHLKLFRQEVGGGGLPSYSHPRRMPDFWQFPTVSMGLAPINSIYQAHFNRYMESRGLANTSTSRVWAFLGDGEMDEPESRGALHLASNEGLDNLVFVVNCNLQRLDGPVRGNGNIIQELESTFRGQGWNVIKVILGREWDELLRSDASGHLIERLNTVVDGWWQRYSTEGPAFVREHFFGHSEELKKLVANMSDDDIWNLRRGGHDYHKLYAAYKLATESNGKPTALLVKTVKGWTLGEGFEGKNATHQMKALNTSQLKSFRDKLELPIDDKDIETKPPFYHPGKKSPEIEYMMERRHALGGPMPRRRVKGDKLKLPKAAIYREFDKGTDGDQEVSTTMAFVRILRKLTRDKEFGPRVVPIIPDEARTFGMESLFNEMGIYSPNGQLYEPVDHHMILRYKEAKDGQILEEGITEAGAMADFTAAGTAYSNHGVSMVPFYIFYSMFGFQRVGDLIWAFGDSIGKGFLLGATAGRTTLMGEGLQHDDGHSQLVATTVPNARAYDPAFAYEMAAIVRDGLDRMYAKNEDCFYYITCYNESYSMPSKPKGVTLEGITKGMYLYREPLKRRRLEAQLAGSGSILREVIRASDILEKEYKVATHVWSCPSWQMLRAEALEAERWNRLHPVRKERVPYVTELLDGSKGPFIASSDWMKTLPELIARFVPCTRFVPLGT